MVEVFKTNVRRKSQSKKMLPILCEVFPLFKINFDLTDCDKILRVEGEHIETEKIAVCMNDNGFQCETLI